MSVLDELDTPAADLEAALKRGRKRDEDAEAMRFVLGDARGRRFFMRLLREAKLFNVTLENNANLYRHEGMRYLGSKFYNEAMKYARRDLRLAQQEEDSRHD